MFFTLKSINNYSVSSNLHTVDYLGDTESDGWIAGRRLNHRIFNRVAPIDGLGVGHLYTHELVLWASTLAGVGQPRIAGFGLRGPAHLVLAI